MIRKILKYFLQDDFEELDYRLRKFEPHNPYLQTQVNQVEEIATIHFHQILDVKRDILKLREDLINLKNK